MNKNLLLAVALLLNLGLASGRAQFGPAGPAASGPQLGGATSQLFGENQTFSATLEFERPDPAAGQTLTIPGKIFFNAGSSRFEMSVSGMQGTKMPPNAAAQIKSMGLDELVVISRPDKKVSWLLYPGMHGYIENSLPSTTTNAGDFKVESKELGRETIEGHPCIKNSVVVVDKDKGRHESIVWNATDLKNFPVKIESTEDGAKSVMRFKDVSFTPPVASVFEVPENFTKYSSIQTMMQTEMMKKMGGGIPE